MAEDGNPQCLGVNLPGPGRPLIRVASGLLRLSLSDSLPASLPDSRDIPATCQQDLEPHRSPADIPGASDLSSNSLSGSFLLYIKAYSNRRVPRERAGIG